MKTSIKNLAQVIDTDVYHNNVILWSGLEYISTTHRWVIEMDSQTDCDKWWGLREVYVRGGGSLRGEVSDVVRNSGCENNSMVVLHWRRDRVSLLFRWKTTWWSQENYYEQEPRKHTTKLPTCSQTSRHFISLCWWSSPPLNPLYARLVGPLALVFSLSSHRHWYRSSFGFWWHIQETQVHLGSTVTGGC
jgi:hypothetical protein